MTETNIRWTALPKEIIQDKNNDVLYLSVQVTPELSGGGKLSDYQLFVDWPTKLKNFDFKLETKCVDESTDEPCKCDFVTDSIKKYLTSKLNSEYWKKLFESNITVEDPNSPSDLAELSNVKYISYPSKEVFKFLEGEYRYFATNFPTQIPNSQDYSFDYTKKFYVNSYSEYEVKINEEEDNILLKITNPDGSFFDFYLLNDSENGDITIHNKASEEIYNDLDKKRTKSQVYCTFKAKKIGTEIIKFKARNNLGINSVNYGQIEIEVIPKFTEVNNKENNIEKTSINSTFNNDIRDTSTKGDEHSPHNSLTNITKSNIAYLATNSIDEDYMDKQINDPSFFAQSNNENKDTDKINFYKVRRIQKLLSPKNTFRLDRINNDEEIRGFHYLIARLNEFPELSSILGLKLNFEIPISKISLPKSPNSDGQYCKIRLIATDLSNNTTYIDELWTEYVLTDGQNRKFLTSWRNGPPSEDSDLIIEKWIVLNKNEDHDLISVDLTDGATKLQNFASNIAGLTADSTESLEFLKNSETLKEIPLPSLSSFGFSIYDKNRERKLTKEDERTREFINDLSNKKSKILRAHDVTKGYRVDVEPFINSQSQGWYSLCKRKGIYTWKKEIPPSEIQTSTELENPDIGEDEGFISIATSSSETSNLEGERKEIVPQSMFKWEGWGLCIEPVGKTLGLNDRAAEPSNKPDDIFKLGVVFKSVKKSLPPLRFGTSYRFRLRAVDLAGNSISPKSNEDKYAFPEKPVPYLRYEPLLPPNIVFREKKEDLKPGESLEHLVIRQYRDSKIDSAESVISERHVVPPKISQKMAETHGMFDKFMFSKDNDIREEAYDKICRKDGELKEYYDQNEFELPYLHDPIIKGVTIVGLPYSETGVEKYEFPEEKDEKGLWSDKIPFRIVLEEGERGETELETAKLNRPIFYDKKHPHDKYGKNVLVVRQLPGDMHDAKISCHIDEDRIDEMAIHNLMKNGSNLSKLKRLKQNVLDGFNWMISPYRQIQFRYAVQQPEYPFELEKKLEVKKRNIGETTAEFYSSDNTLVSGKTTQQVEIIFKWEEIICNKEKRNGYDKLPFKTNAFQIPINIQQDNVTIGDQYQLPDTKYRKVEYSTKAISRFKEYYDLKTDVSLASSNKTKSLDVLNSKRPEIPKILYAIPIFKWDSDENTSSNEELELLCGCLRIYIDGPWYTSGEGELLGIVLGSLDFPKIAQSYCTQWGMDPISVSTPLPRQTFPSLDDFSLYSYPNPNSVNQDNKFSLEEFDKIADKEVSIVGYDVKFDYKRKLWYSDIQLKPGNSYFPFVNFAFTSFQPNSIKHAHLSRVNLSLNFIQLAPGRYLSYTLSEQDPPESNITFSGITNNQKLEKQKITVEVTLEEKAEQRDKNSDTWIASDKTEVLKPISTNSSKLTTWTGSVKLPTKIKKDKYRLRIEEFEEFCRQFDENEECVKWQKRLICSRIMYLKEKN